MVIPLDAPTYIADATVPTAKSSKVVKVAKVATTSVIASKLFVNQSWAKALKPFVCSAMSTTFASLCVHPVDLLKTRTQVSGKGALVAKWSSRKMGALTILCDAILKKEPILNFWAGYGSEFCRQCLYGSLRIGLHRTFSNHLKENLPTGASELPILQTAGCALTAGAIASLFSVPFDMAKLQMQVDSQLPLAQRRNYKSSYDALHQIITTKGALKNMGFIYPVVLTRACAINVVMMVTYDKTKAKMEAAFGPGWKANLSACGLASTAVTFVYAPLDRIRSILVTQKPKTDGTKVYTGMLDCAWKIARRDGITYLWRGCTALYVMGFNHAFIILNAVQIMEKAYQKHMGV